MSRRLPILFISLFTFIISHAQKMSPAEFAVYAQKQDSMMTKCYYDRKPDQFIILLKDFETRFNLLSKEEQVGFRIYHFNALYNLSCTYALLHDKTAALDWLEKAVAAGYIYLSHLLEDTDMNELRKEDRYLKLEDYLHQIADYRSILRRAADYDHKEQRILPAFTYQQQDNPDLQTLRKAFHLDSIAGTGNEVSKIINLMHWIHYLIPHDGAHGNPVVMNAYNLINTCRSEKRGLNCRGLATVLNECYLAMGFRSRFVTCLPKDSLGIDVDCHVINMVWSDDLKKWLWMDPTNDAYVMNEKGELLSVAEVRERVISGATVILNPDANWNRRSTAVVGEYLYNYMAKNMYMFECPVSSEYDTETRKQGKKVEYIRLTPLDYFKRSDKTTTETGKTSQLTLVTHQTSNPEVFWQDPPAAGK